MSRRITAGVALALALLALSLSPVVRADHGSGGASSHAEHGYHKHLIGFFVGAASDDLGRRDGGFALGAEYEFRPHHRFGIGVMLEHTYGDLDTWVYVLPFSYHTGNWKLYAGPGIEEGHHGHENMLRLGFEYGFHTGNWVIAPQVDIDFIERERDVFVLGITFARGFDFQARRR